jgi:pimeloyl-ACP methyl ester carboxylesterase
MTLQTITVSGVHAQYAELNPAASQTILMVHGFRGNHIGLLKIAKRLPHYRILIPDLPGHGQTMPMPKTRHDIPGFSGFVRAFASTMDLDKYVLLGHSFGALITAQIAAEEPAGIKHLILVNPVSESNKVIAKVSSLYYKVGFALPPPWDEHFLFNRIGANAMSIMMAKTPDKALRREIFAHHRGDLRFGYQRRVVMEAVDAVLNQEVFTYAQAIHLPTLIIAGERDDLAPLAVQKKLQGLISDSWLEVIPGVGHLTHLETPVEVAAIITHYLDHA